MAAVCLGMPQGIRKKDLCPGGAYIQLGRVRQQIEEINEMVSMKVIDRYYEKKDKGKHIRNSGGGIAVENGVIRLASLKNI